MHSSQTMKSRMRVYHCHDLHDQNSQKICLIKQKCCFVDNSAQEFNLDLFPEVVTNWLCAQVAEKYGQGSSLEEALFPLLQSLWESFDSCFGIQLFTEYHMQDMQSKSLKQLSILHFSWDYIPTEKVDYPYWLINKIENILSLNK